ncbi:uncharacterized protein LOC117338351 [Pecten maximus]|uniref:uncharacterized protein LOC117338351 n=1 Tax=Pecten maximus TaxID=6579 RepID=UPI001458B695|nr:uncharacterized protein LOC117338351 [Pecten maximus]
MSVWNERFQTLASNDLASQTLPSDGHVFRPENVRLVKEPGDEVIRAENARLKEENRQLRQCLVSMSENASLRTAQVLASLLVWSDEKLAGQTKKFLSKDTLNNNDTKLRSSPTVSPFRPISPGQTLSHSHGPPKQQVSATSQGRKQYPSVSTPQHDQYNPGQYQLSGPNQPSKHPSDLFQHGSQLTPTRPPETILSLSGQPQNSGQRNEQNLNIPGSSQKQPPRHYSPRNYISDDPAVVIAPSSPSVSGRQNSSRSPLPPNRSPVSRSKSPVSRNKSPVPRDRSPSQPSIPTGQSRSNVLTPTVNGGSAQLFTDTASPSFRNTAENKTMMTSNQKYPGSASSIDDRLEKLLSRQIVPGEYATTNAADPGQMPGSPFSVSVGDRRVAVSGILDQTGSEGYGSVPSSLGQFGGDQSGRGVHPGQGMDQYSDRSVRTTNSPASVARKAVGDPIATSTPARPRQQGGAADTLPYTDSLEQSGSSLQRPGTNSLIAAGSNVLHRPIDSVIGFKPTLTESHCQKLAKIEDNTRLVGEIAFQLDRRILQYVFSKKFDSQKYMRKRYYGYSTANIEVMIGKEAMDEQVKMRSRFNEILKKLSSFGYIPERHGNFAQDMVNKYGLLTVPPDKQMVKICSSEDPVIIRVLLSKLLRSDAELQDELVLWDCLYYLAYKDRKAIFRW